jgi:hypothetical protein
MRNGLLIRGSGGYVGCKNGKKRGKKRTHAVILIKKHNPRRLKLTHQYLSVD